MLLVGWLPLMMFSPLFLMWMAVLYGMWCLFTFVVRVLVNRRAPQPIDVRGKTLAQLRATLGEPVRIHDGADMSERFVEFRRGAEYVSLKFSFGLCDGVYYSFDGSSFRRY